MPKKFSVKKTELQALTEKIRKGGKKLPLEFVIEVMNDTRIQVGNRLDAAKYALPYFHKKLPVDINTTGEVKIIPPFVPSKQELQAQYKDELEEQEESRPPLLEAEPIEENEETDILDDL